MQYRGDTVTVQRLEEDCVFRRQAVLKSDVVHDDGLDQGIQNLHLEKSISGCISMNFLSFSLFCFSSDVGRPCCAHPRALAPLFTSAVCAWPSNQRAQHVCCTQRASGDSVFAGADFLVSARARARAKESIGL